MVASVVGGAGTRFTVGFRLIRCLTGNRGSGNRVLHSSVTRAELSRARSPRVGGISFFFIMSFSPVTRVMSRLRK